MLDAVQYAATVSCTYCLINEGRDLVYLFHCSIFITKSVWHIVGVWVFLFCFNMKELSTPDVKKAGIPLRNKIGNITHGLLYQPWSFQ